MSTHSAVLCAIDGDVATLTLNRPDALNTLDLAMIEALVHHARTLVTTPGLRCVVVRGAGRHFMAGGDLRAFARQLPMAAPERAAWFTAMVRELHAAIELIDRMPCPVIGAAHGAVAGFGLSLLIACDLAIASEDAYFSSAYRHIGLTPDGGMSWFLPRAVGTRRAMEIILLGERFDARAAERMGLLNRVVPADALDDAVATTVKAIVAGPAAALGRARRLVRQSPAALLSTQLEAEAVAFGQSAGTEDFAEGITAFLDKRAPSFGRG